MCMFNALFILRQGARLEVRHPKHSDNGIVRR